MFFNVTFVSIDSIYLLGTKKNWGNEVGDPGGPPSNNPNAGDIVINNIPKETPIAHIRIKTSIRTHWVLSLIELPFLIIFIINHLHKKRLTKYVLQFET